MQYRPEIDGLRAIAIVPVVLFHAGIPGFTGGFVGVDIFFVISGYLISSLLLEDLEKGRFSVAAFYDRRARRILPPLLLVMGCCIPFAWTLLDPYELKEFSQSLVGTSVFMANVFFWLKTGYFDVAADEKPLLHMWSLAVEEQFYLVFPLLLAGLWRVGGQRTTAVVAGLCAASFALAEAGSRFAPAANFYLPAGRAWELLVGCLCALAMRQRATTSRPSLEATGLLLIAGSVALFTRQTPFPSAYTLAPVAGTALLIVSSTGQQGIGRLLASPPVVRIGLWSYGTYLWHQPILAFLRIATPDHPSPASLAAALAAAVGLAALSHRYVELPFRRRGTPDSWPTRRVVRILGMGSAALLLAGAAGHLTNGFPTRSPLFERLAQNYGLDAACNGNRLGDPRCITGPAPEVVIWGDSYAMHIVRAVATGQAPATVAQVTLSACPPIVGFEGAARKTLAISCRDFNDRTLADIVGARASVRKVYLASSFDALRGPDATATIANLVDTVRRLQAEGIAVAIVGPSPVPEFNLARCIRRQIRRGQPLSGCDFRETAQSHRDTMQVLAETAATAGATLIDLSATVCGNGTCRASVGDLVLYRDAGHFSIESASYLSQAFRTTP